MRSHRGAGVLILVAALTFMAGNLWETFRRSAIPVALDGRVERLEVRREKHPGVDDVHLVAVDGRTIHVDEAQARPLEVDTRVVKQGWSTHMTVNGRDLTIRPSRDFYGMAIAMPILFLILLALLKADKSQEVQLAARGGSRKAEGERTDRESKSPGDR